ncbi:MAG: biopolymer transporter ExbD [Dysgonamonadaceae bacterium]|jgi:biopolymer transport protein ExbD|nr:biopolymer transporter ExbD [Dysgonamonadaceae bacterium]
MAEVQQNEKGEGGKNKQKKQHLRVDFTPMVDMNMLLITFFMFCTTLLKPQTMNINMPMKDENLTEEEKTKIKESGAITLLLGANDELYYYLGIPKDQATYDDSTYLVTSSYGGNGIRKLLLEKNTGTYERIQELKAQLKEGVIVDSVFKAKSKVIQEAAKEYAPTVMIKPTELATYKNMVDALDEMLITNIGAYAIVDLTPGDRFFLYQRTGNKDYLTDEQRAEIGQK